MSLSNENENNDDLPTEVLDRVNIGVIAISLSLFDEGMTIQELSKSTGIHIDEVKRAVEILHANRMIKKRMQTGNYIVINFKKLLRFLINNGLVYPSYKT